MISKRSVEEFGQEFGRGLKQVCSLCPVFFTLYIADVEVCMRREQIGEVVGGRKKFMVFEYADNLAMVAKIEEDKTGMLKRFRHYAGKKILILFLETSKMMVRKTRKEEVKK